MNLFAIYLANEFKRGWQYRMEIPMMWFAYGLTLAVQIFLWKALYNGHNSVSGVEIHSILQYFILSSIITVLLPRRLSAMLGTRINTGMISGDLLKPIAIKWHLALQVLSSNFFNVIFVMLPITSIFSAFLKISFNIPLFSFLFIIPSIMLAIFIVIEIGYIMGLWCFWTGSNIFTGFIESALYVLFSGMVLPIYFMPQWLMTLTKFLPFRYAIFEPLNMITQFNVHDAAMSLVIQGLWFLVLLILDQMIWSRAQKRIFVVGG